MKHKTPGGQFGKSAAAVRYIAPLAEMDVPIFDDVDVPIVAEIDLVDLDFEAIDLDFEDIDLDFETIDLDFEAPSSIALCVK